MLQGYNDKDHGLLTNALTVQRSSQRLMLALAPSLLWFDKSFNIYSRDITQAYTQSENPVTRRIYANPPSEMNLPRDKELQIVYPLYGLPEAGALWFHTYQLHHLERLNLTNATHDLCFFYTPSVLLAHKKKQPASLTCLQTDDTLFIGNEPYIRLENAEGKRFSSKPVEILGPKSSILFNGIQLSRNGVSLSTDASQHALKMKEVPLTANHVELYTSERAPGAYIASHCRPDLSY